MKTPLRSAFLFSVITSLIACGGSGSDGTGKQLSIESLSENLPAANVSLDTSTPAGLWIGNFSHTNSIDNDSTTLSSTENGRSLFFITPFGSGSRFDISQCSSTDSIFGNTVFTLTDNTLIYQDEDNWTEDSEEMTYIINLQYSMGSNLSAEMEGHEEDYFNGGTSINSYRMVAVKISNATTLTEAASEFDINYLASGSSTTTFSDVSDTMQCVSSSREKIRGSANEDNYSGVITHINVETEDDDIQFSEFDLKGIDTEGGFFRFYDSGEIRNVGCGSDDCETLTNISVDITEETDEQLAFTATGSGDSDLPDVSVSFSISAK